MTPACFELKRYVSHNHNLKTNCIFKDSPVSNKWGRVNYKMDKPNQKLQKSGLASSMPFAQNFNSVSSL